KPPKAKPTVLQPVGSDVAIWHLAWAYDIASDFCDRLCPPYVRADGSRVSEIADSHGRRPRDPATCSFASPKPPRRAATSSLRSTAATRCSPAQPQRR